MELGRMGALHLKAVWLFLALSILNFPGACSFSSDWPFPEDQEPPRMPMLEGG